MYLYPQTSLDLIQAIVNANGSAGPSTIYLQANQTYDFSNSYSNSTSALPQITGTLTIIGNGSILRRSPAASANFRLLSIASSATVELRSLIITGGKLPINQQNGENGGGIRNQGHLTVNGCQIRANQTMYGGGISNLGGTLILLNSIIEDNQPVDTEFTVVAGIWSNSTLEIDNTVFRNNGIAASSCGTGGLDIAAGTAVIRNSAFYGNRGQDGAAIRVGGTLTLEYCDIYDNVGNNQGGAIFALGNPTVVIHNCRIFANQSGPNGEDVTTTVPIDARQNWWGASNGPSGVGLGSGDSIDSNVDYIPWLDSEDCVHEATCECPYNYAGSDCLSSGNPISLRLGEKRLDETDIAVNTPAGWLAFTRSYRQEKQADPEYQLMGLGWTHNFDLTLSFSGTSPDRTATVKLPKGGKLILDEISAGVFQAATGSGSDMKYDSGVATYTLIAQDKTTYVFAAVSGKLVSQSWPGGEVWSYSYAASHLIEIDDGYGRKLKFSYYDKPGEVQNGRLWRVGDQTAGDLDTATPSGRFIEFAYTPQKSDGNPVMNPQALLLRVTDVRGNTWRYDYYGQTTGQTDADLLDRLIARVSPEVDTDGDGSADIELTLERLTYLFHIDLAVNGNMQDDSDWTDIVGQSPQINERSTAQVDTGTYSRHVVADDADDGIEGNSWNLVAGRSYAITARVYPVSGAVWMRVSGATTLNDSSGGTGAWETLTIAHTPSATTEGHHLQFVASGGVAEFYVDSVTIIETSPDLSRIVQERGIAVPDSALLVTDYAFAFNGQAQTLETTSSRQTIHYFERGIASGSTNPAGETTGSAPNGMFRSGQQTDAIGNSTFLNWKSGGKLLDGVTNALGQTTAFHYDSLDRLAFSLDAQQRRMLHFYAVATLRQPTHLMVTDESVTASNLVANGDMELTSDWSNVGSPTTNARTSAQVDSGSYSRRVNGGSGTGIQSTPWDIVAGRPYLVCARVYPVSGVVKMGVSGTASFDTTSSGTNAWQTLLAIYTPQGASSGVRLQFTAQGGAAEFYVDSVFVLGGDRILRWQEFTYDPKGRMLSEELINNNGIGVLQRTTRVYGTVGNENGLLTEVTIKDLLNPSNDKTTIYTYDSAGRVIKTHQSSLLGTCQFSYTVYDPAGNVVATVCGRQNAVTVPTSVQTAIAMYDANDPIKKDNVVTTHDYDTLGRRIRTVTNAGTTFAQTSLTVYDALSRVVRTIGNYVVDVAIPNPYTAPHSAFNHGTDNNQNLITEIAYNRRGMVRKRVDILGNTTLYGYDEADRLVKTVQNAATPGYDNDYSGDPDLSTYSASSTVDHDIITSQSYDPAGNLVKSVDARGIASFTVYDALNRPVKTVQNAKDTATVELNPDDPAYMATDDPRSEDYVVSLDPDRDLMVKTEYDAAGHIVRARQLRENRDMVEEWDVTLYGHDSLGRQVRTIRSASNPNYNIKSDPDLSDYLVSSDSDQDILTLTMYDAAGRVLETTDVNGNKTRVVYDGLNRQVKSIANYISMGDDPSSWVWSLVNNRWQTNSGSPINHGTKNDQNIITETVYDSDGRVLETRDVLGRVSRNVYDASGRMVRTVQNYVEQGASNPLNWTYSSGWKQSNAGGAPVVSHGADNDENQISSTTYDAQGRVLETLDHRNNVTRFVYDGLGRQVKTIVNYVVQGTSDPSSWLWSLTNQRWENGAGVAISFGADVDQNRISTTVYDLAGRVERTRDASGIETRYEYDALGRRTKTTTHYIDGTFSASLPDEDLISTTTYNKGGQMVSSTDARGTQTSFTYDKAGRRLTVTEAANSSLARMSYTCYDKVGRVLRTITNYVPLYCPSQTSDDAPDYALMSYMVLPDEWTSSGVWRFVPPHNGAYNDMNLISAYSYDRLGRQLSMTDAAGSVVQTSYYKDGQAEGTIDPEGMVTKHRYDGARRRWRVIQSYVGQGTSLPENWVWEANVWKQQTGGTTIAHGSLEDQNIIVDVTYDVAGRVMSQREPRGNVTSYTHDKLNRRKSLSNPLARTWTSAYADLVDGRVRASMTMPGITGATNYIVQREFDRLGRPYSVAYGAPGVTPDVRFSYDNAGNRQSMSEYSGVNFSNRIRETRFSYDDVRRLTSVGFDNEGDGTVDETVSYEYDAGGLRTKLSLLGNLNIVYSYNAQGQMVSLTDWSNQTTAFSYDRVGRHIASERHNGLRSRYTYDAASRLRQLHHSQNRRTLAQFSYEVDKRGNRSQAFEVLAQPATTSDTVIGFNDRSLVTIGAWSEVNGFKETQQFEARLVLIFMGDEATLTMGTGPDHSLYDVYVGGSLWQSFDGYAATAGQRDIAIPTGIDGRNLSHDGPHIVEIRNRAERHRLSTNYRLRFKQLVVLDRAYRLQTISYTYDALSRLREARTAAGVNAQASDAQLLRREVFSFDRSGNRTQQSLALNGAAASVTSYSYNSANQLISDGTNSYSYDPNGNLTSDTWDRANRLLSGGGASFAYDGAGNRIRQMVGADVTRYLLDLQPGLALVLSQTTGANTERYVHSPRGIHAQHDAANNWEWMVQDGLGSVRSVADNNAAVLWATGYSAYGEPIHSIGTAQTLYGFTGEATTGNGDVFLRARHYRPSLGIFPSLDPFEGVHDRPMSLNGYSWVEGNVPNGTDASGNCPENPAPLDVFGWRCRFLAEGLATKTNQPVQNFMRLDYGQLELLTVLGTVADASILPSLALREDPSLVLQAIHTFNCQNPYTIMSIFGVVGGAMRGGSVGSELSRSNSNVGRVGGLLTALQLGIGLGIAALLGVNSLNRTREDEEDNDCTYEKIMQRIGGRTVAQVVGYVSNIRSGEPEYHLGDPPNGVIFSSGQVGVIGKAIDICKNGDISKYSDYYLCGSGVDCKGFRILSDGNATFVARRVMGQSIAHIEQYIRPSGSIAGVLEDQDEADYYLASVFNWENIPWKR